MHVPNLIKVQFKELLFIRSCLLQANQSLIEAHQKLEMHTVYQTFSYFAFSQNSKKLMFITSSLLQKNQTLTKAHQQLEMYTVYQTYSSFSFRHYSGNSCSLQVPCCRKTRQLAPLPDVFQLRINTPDGKTLHCSPQIHSTISSK